MQSDKDSITLEKEEYPEDSRDDTQLTGLAHYCQDLYEEYRNSDYRQRKFAEIKEGRRRFRLDLPAKTFPWEDCSNKTLGVEQIVVKKIVPRLINQILAEEDFINMLPVGEEDAEYTQEAEEFLEWALVNNMRIERRLKEVVLDLALDGTVDIVPVWEEKQEFYQIRTTTPIFVNRAGEQVELPPEYMQNQKLLQMMLSTGEIAIAGETDNIEESEQTCFKVRLDVMPLPDCFFPDTWENWDEAPYLRFVYPTLYRLEEMSEKNGGPYKNISADLVVDPARLMDDEAVDQDDKGVQFSEYTKQVKLLECYVIWRDEWTLASFAIDSGWMEVRRQRITEVYPYDRKPIHRIRLNPMSDESMGTGMPRIVEHLSKGMDDLVNIAIDSWTDDVVDGGYVTNVPGIHRIFEEKAIGRPRIIPQGAEVQFPPKTRSMSQGALQFIELLLAFLEKTVSLMDHTLSGDMAGQGAGTKTLGGIRLIMANSDIEHQYTGGLIRDAAEPLYMDIMRLYAMNMPLDAKRRVFEEDEWVFKPVDLKAIQGNFDLRIEISDIQANQALARQEASEKLQALAQNPVANLLELTKDYLESWGHKDPDKYLLPQMREIIQAIMEYPQLLQVVRQAVQQFAGQKEQKEVEDQARRNILRQNTQRDLEVRTGQEDRKIVDQVAESTKRDLFKPAVQQSVVREMMARRR